MIVDPYRLIQEDHAEDPWRVLLACVLLNQTRGAQVVPVLERLLDEWPNAHAMSEAPPEDVTEIVAPLGLKKRGGYIVEMSADYLRVRPKEWRDVLELTGCGRYAAEAWRMLVQGDRTFMPKDLKLRARMLWWRLDECEVLRDGSGRVGLFLPGSCGQYPTIAIPPDQTGGGWWRDIVLTSSLDRRNRWREIPPNEMYPLGHEPSAIAQRWLDDQSMVKLTDRAKEATMLLVLNAKKRFAGKFADDQIETAKAAVEAGVVVANKEELLQAVPDLRGLVVVYNSIVEKDSRVDKFADDMDAAGAADMVLAAAEAKQVKVKPPLAVREPGAKEKVRAALIAAGATGLTLDEMVVAAGGGVNDHKRVSDYMCYLKNPKYAGEKGPIEIFRIGDRYTVDKDAKAAYDAEQARLAEEAKSKAAEAAKNPAENAGANEAVQTGAEG